MADCHRRVLHCSVCTLRRFNDAGWRHHSASTRVPELLQKMRKKFMVVYLVRSYRTYARIRSLTTGTFNLVVKDRIAFRLSGAPSVQANPLARANPTVLETLQPYRSRSTLSTPASHSISTCFPHWEKGFETRTRRAPPLKPCHSERHYREASTSWGVQQHATISPSALDLQRRRFLSACRSGRQKIEKRS